MALGVEVEVACRTADGASSVLLRHGGKPPFVLELVRDGRTAARYEDEDVFSCLLALRRDLERDGVVLCCAGALRNAYPSAMSRSAGGFVVYLLVPGQPASETADIFDPAPCEDAGTVDEQLGFYRSWLASLDAVPAPLAAALQRARATLAAHPDSRVPLPERGAIWHALDEPEGDDALFGPGHRRRARLARMAVEKVERFWEEAYPGDPAVAQILDAARRAVDGGVDGDEVDRRIDGLWYEIGERTTDESRFRASYVGYAACGALRTAVADEPMGYADEGLDEHDLDVEAWDTAWWAAAAHGGGATGEAAYRPELRREFWEWYLDEAVPAAWRAV